MKVCVIGAGVVGCSTAYLLQRTGHEVTVLDAAPSAGLGTSFANGGQLSYSYVEPLASPATLRSLPALLLDASSPVRFRLRADWRQWRWLAAFLWSCRHSRAAAGTRALLGLAQDSRSVLEQWIRDEALDFAFARNGKLVLCPNERVLASQRDQVALQAVAGVKQDVLDRKECLAREPALVAYENFVGGVWTPTECVADPHLYCKALERAAVERGASFCYGVTATGFVHKGGHAHAVTCSAGTIDADAFVLCGGVQSPALAASLGESLPIYPIKGYSVTLRMKPGGRSPMASVTDLSRKMVLAPIGGELRVAAMAEIVGHDRRVRSERIGRILSAVEQIYPGLCELDPSRPWAGLRPATPDSVPIIRPSRVRNVLLNVGHGALGFTLAAGSAVRVRALLET
jgi:D-amino-acid dehydrogenase